MHLDYQARKRIEDADMIDLMDRFVTAVERIADALEHPQISAASNLVFDPNSASGFKVANSFGDR